VQGGIDESDLSREAAMLREVKEELGLAPQKDELVVVKELEMSLTYLVPEERRTKGYSGQEMSWWIVYFGGDLQECDLEGAKEFLSVRWADWAWLLENAPEYKTGLYAKLRTLAAPVIARYLAKRRTKSHHPQRETVT